MAEKETPALQVKIERQPSSTIVHCIGRIDIDSWARLSVLVRELIPLVPDGRPIRVDLAKVTRLDSTGIGALVGLWTAAKRRNCDLKYANLSGRIEDAVRVTGLLGMLEEHPAQEGKLRGALGT